MLRLSDSLGRCGARCGQSGEDGPGGPTLFADCRRHHLKVNCTL